MISKDEYLAFIERIVTEVVPSEKTAFTVAGPQIANVLYAGPDLRLTANERRPSEFQFLDTATQVLQFVGLMIGTFNTIRTFIKTVRPPRETDSKETVVSEWMKELQQYGLPDAKAKEIATRFGDELAKSVKE